MPATTPNTSWPLSPREVGPDKKYGWSANQWRPCLHRSKLPRRVDRAPLVSEHWYRTFETFDKVKVTLMLWPPSLRVNSNLIRHCWVLITQSDTLYERDGWWYLSARYRSSTWGTFTHSSIACRQPAASSNRVTKLSGTNSIGSTNWVGGMPWMPLTNNNSWN